MGQHSRQPHRDKAGPGDLDPALQDEIVQRYEAGELTAHIVAHLRELGLPATQYWVESTLDEHRVIRHARPNEIPEAAPLGFSVSAQTRAFRAAREKIENERKTWKEDARKARLKKAADGKRRKLEARLKKAARKHAKGRGPAIGVLAAEIGVARSTLNAYMLGNGYTVVAEPMSSRPSGPLTSRLPEVRGREGELAQRILDGGETVRALADEIGVDHIRLAAELKRTGYLPNVNLSRYRAQMRKREAQ